MENFCTREATLKDNATTQKVNRTYQQVVTLNYARSTRQWSGNLTIPTNGRLLNASVDGEPLVIRLKNAIPKGRCGIAARVQ